MIAAGIRRIIEPVIRSIVGDIPDGVSPTSWQDDGSGGINNPWNDDDYWNETGTLDRFVSTWDTENLGGTGSATKTIVLPMTAGVRVNWGDGTADNLNTHIYATGGIKTISIADAVTGWRFNNGGDKAKLLTVESTGLLDIDDFLMFFGCSNMTDFVLSATSTYSTTTLTSMFRDCSSLINLDISFMDTTGVTTMGSMFSNCSSLLSLDVSNFNTSSVIGTGFNSTFSGCSSLTALDVSSFDTSGVAGMNGFFRDCSSIVVGITGIEDLDITLVTDMANFLFAVTLPTAQYSELLVNYEAQSVQDTVTFSGGSSKYSAGAAATARQDLIDDHTWTITDGGAA